ncbi:MAG TPA: hypothetical protein VEX64_08715, partial [Pyrinomonadaceae bacterium]|nr:hypothetical protein [Pyrinomonadaceae bacterium]
KAGAEQAKNEVERLETEIQKRLQSHRETSDQIKEAERGAEAESRIKALETERKTIEIDLKAAEQAETSLRLLVPQRKQIRAEIEKLQEALARNERDAAGFDEIARLAAEAAQLNARENTLVAEIAGLQAKIQHDEKFQGEVKNGLCPILSQKCLNIRPDETLETYFQNELSANYQTLQTLTSEQKAVSVNLSSAREAERRLAKLESLRNQVETGRADLRQREMNLQKIEGEIAAFSNFKPEALEALRFRKGAIEQEISVWNIAARKYAEILALKQRRDDIKEEGSRLRDEQNKAKEFASSLPEIDARLIEIERKLKELNNPRVRAESLKQEAENESQWRGKIETAKSDFAEKEKSHRLFAEKLTLFNTLDADLARVRAERERTAPAYQKYLANRALAESLPARESELKQASEETQKLEREFLAVSKEHEAAAANYNHERHFTEKAALLDAQRREAETAAKLDDARRRETALKQEIDRLAAIREQMKSEFKEKYKLERVAETTDFIRDTLRKAAPEVAKSYLYSISKEANEIFREVAGSAEHTLRWTEDYEIMLEESGHERPFINLSGGEQMAAALSIRLALLKQLSDVRIAFFDEPTTNLDSERRERLAQQIGQIRNFDQLFVISHDDTFDENVDYQLHVSSNRNGNEDE